MTGGLSKPNGYFYNWTSDDDSLSGDRRRYLAASRISRPPLGYGRWTGRRSVDGDRVRKEFFA